MSNAYFSLSTGSLTQNWSNTGLITADDNWGGVASIEGYRGDGLAATTGVNPATITGTSAVLDVNANRSDPNTFTTGGVSEFDGIADPTVALQGSGTARAPYLIFYLDATGQQNVNIQFDARDIDGSADNSVQPIAVQYRLGPSGTWTNVPVGTTPVIADASNGGSATLVTPVNVTLPADANGEAQLQVRVLTTDAVGSDEWIGIDNIAISSAPISDTTPPSLTSTTPSDEATNVSTTGNIVLVFDENVQFGSGDIVISDGASDTRTITVGTPDADGTVSISNNTVTIDPAADLAAGATYHVTIANGVIQDTSTNNFAGIGAGGLDFTTAANQTFAIAADDAGKNEGSLGTTPFTFTVTRVNPSGTATVDWALTGLGGAGHADAADFSGPTSGSLTFTGSETSKTVTLNVVGDLAVEPDESFSVTLSNASPGSSIGIASANGTILNDDVPLTAIYAIQGNGHISPLAGNSVTTTGVVTAVDTNGSRGFYLQDPSGDGDASTSDGIFVFLPGGALPTVGDFVRVSGTVQEFLFPNSALGSLSTTEISLVTNVTDLGVGPAIAPVLIGGAGGLVPPTESLIAGAQFFESLEGMVVTVRNAQAVGPTNNFGEIFTAVDNDTDPSNGTTATGQTTRGNLLLTPGTGDFGDANSSGGDFNPERVQIDDDSGVMGGFVPPAVNVGARLSDVTGIVNYDFGNYQVIATQPYSVVQPSSLTKETGTLLSDANHLLVVSYNAENLDPGDGAARFATIADQILNNLNAPDIVALQEVQDNNGPTDNGVTSADVTLQTLVNDLNAAAPAGVHYAFIDNPFIGNDSNGGEPGGNIRTAFLYRTDRVSLSGSLSTLAADGHAITNPDETAADGNGDQQNNPNNPFFDSRPPLVATFLFNGQEVTIVDNHFTSKGGSAALLGSDQPPFSAGEVQRAAQAQAVNNFVDGLLALDPNAKVIVAGDLNEFPFEEPMQVLKGTANISHYAVPGEDPFDAVADYTAGGIAVLNDLQDLLPADQRYDYVFEGNSETLDHIFVSNGLDGKAEFDVVRINAEFADQTSDHDPLAARFDMTPVVGQLINGTTRGDVLTGADGNDTINGLAGKDSLAGGDGNDALDGGSSNDTVSGGRGADTLTGGLGADSLNGGLGGDQLSGSDGNDTIDGGAGADSMTGGVGNDHFVVDDAGDQVSEDVSGGADSVETGLSAYTLSGNVENLTFTGSGAFTGTGNTAANSISGGSSGDVLAGGDGKDSLFGGAGLDTLSGDDANDKLFGEEGNDSLSGGAGNDSLDGGPGNDKMAGGLGGDKFVFTGSDAPTGGAQLGEITDFSHAQKDKIDLSAIDAISGGGDDAFVFIGPEGTLGTFGTPAAGHLHYVVSGLNVVVEGDTNGDGIADFAIVVDNVGSLSSADFVL